MPVGYHVTIRLRDDRVIAPSPAARRLIARIVLARCRPFGLLAFRASDTHLHIEVTCDEPAANEMARRVEIALQLRLHLPERFEPARVRPIERQWHLYNTFNYIFRQDEHHGVDSDPYFDASNLQDLLGLRLLGRYTLPAVRERLPRVTRPQLLQYLGCTELEPVPLRLDLLADAAAATVALPDLSGRSNEAVHGRVAAVHVAGATATADLAAVLGMTERTVRNLRAAPADPNLVRAVDLQLRLRATPRVDPWALRDTG